MRLRKKVVAVADVIVVAVVVDDDDDNDDDDDFPTSNLFYSIWVVVHKSGFILMK